MEEVHFHEGGGGFVKCAHGKMPVPAPATAEILEGVSMKYNVVPSETTTPTGAAILKATVDEFTDYMNFTIDKIGYGLGHKDFEIPNLTSVGYGANLGGIATLLAMLNSCASGVSIVNIDNGFGAAYSASMINKL